MRITGIALLPLTFGLAFGSTEKDHVRTLKQIPDLNEAQLKAALRRIDRDTVAKMEAYHVPGLTMTIVKDGKVVWLKGYGYRNLEKKQPMTPDTIMMIASCSKAFTSTLALMAAQDGKLSLDDPVRKYLPYFHMKDPDADKHMTVADLMCHSSGLPRTDVGWPTEKLDDKACVELLAKCEPTFMFRENAQYSNVLVNTASMVTAAAYGKPWPQLLKEKITDPLGMSSTSTEDPTKIDPARMSIGYFFNPLTRRIERERYMNTDSIVGAGMVKSTGRDLSHWLQFHLGEGTYEGHKILNSFLLSQAYASRQRSGTYMGFGLGWYTDETYPELVVEHGGDLPGFQTLVCLVPSKHLGIAFSDNNDAAGLRGPLLNSILENFIGKRDTKWDVQPSKEIGTFVDPSAHHMLRIAISGFMFATLDQGKPIGLVRKGWRTYETADARNPQIIVKFSDDPMDKDHPQVSVTTPKGETIFRTSVKFDSGTTVQALMDKTVLAYGSAKYLTKPLNIEGRYEADLYQEGLHVQGLLERSNNDLGYMEMLYDGPENICTTLQSINSRSGGSTQNDFRYWPLLGSEVVDAQLDADVCQALNWKSKFLKVEIIARQTLDGEPVYVLRKTPARSPTEIIDFVSEKSGLVLRREAGNPASVTLFGDYRFLDGVLLPYHMTWIDSSYHKEEVHISSYKTVDRYLHWAFNPIGSAKPPKDP